MRVIYGLAYALILIATAALGEYLFWIVLALSFGICVVEMQKLLAREGQSRLILACLGMGFTFLSLGVLQGYFGRWSGVIGFLVLAFIFDTASYFGGRYFQGPKLIPALSPGKTRSGLICGLLAAVFASFFLIRADAALTQVIFALILGFAFLAGDLLISWLKRRAHVKDTGDLIPGHGGLLDRMDSLLIAAPLYWLLLLSIS